MRNFILLMFLLVPTASSVQAQSQSARIYVQRIEFLNTGWINDEVLRRELLQAEGTYINTVALEQSRLRLERLPYVERAQVTLRPVKDTPDQVDILVTITAAPARRYGGGEDTRNRSDLAFTATSLTKTFSGAASGSRPA